MEKTRSSVTLFKRILSLALAFVLLLGMVPVTSARAADEITLYLQPNANWKVDGARFAVYYWNGSGDGWADMEICDEDGIYEGAIPADATNIIFCRMNPGTAENDWNYKWNQTADLDVPTDGTNLYTMTEGSWDSGSWSSYGEESEEPSSEPTPVPTTTAATESEDEEAALYIVAGDSALCGTNWDPANPDNAMTKAEDGTYYIVYPNVAAGTYNLKVTDGTWNNSWGDGGNNYIFEVSDTCDVTVTFDPSTYTVTVTGDNVAKETGLEITTMVAVGNGSGNWLNGANWDVASTANVMTEISDNVYEITFKDVAAGSYEFKFAANGSWTHSWGGGDRENVAVHNGQNIPLTITYALADVTLQLDMTGYNHETKSGATYSVTITEAVAEPTVDYYLIGYINGADYGCNDDYANLGEYKFADGKLTAKFDTESYVFLKTGDNASWFMTQAYATDSSATFYNTTSGASEKLYVPGGVELEFTLVENADGSLTLSYAEAATEPEEPTVDYYLIGYINGADYGCNDDYANLGEYKFVNGKLTAKFDADSYVFVKTGDNASWFMSEGYAAEPPATLYNTSIGLTDANKLFVPGGVEYDFTLVENEDGTLTLSYAAAVDTNDVTLHFYKPEGWGSNINAYLWIGSGTAVTGYEEYNTWPGKAISANAEHEGWYDLTVSTASPMAFNFIFNDKIGDAGNQTDDLSTGEVTGDTELWIVGNDVMSTAPGEWSGDYDYTAYLHFQKPADWPDTVNAWIWDANGAIPGYEEYNTTWPGSPIEADTVNSGWYNLSVTMDENAGFSFLFNGGSDIHKTADLSTGILAVKTHLWIVDGQVLTAAPDGWKDPNRTFHVPGTFPGPSWDAGSNTMTWDPELGLYVYTFENVPPANYQYKISVSGSWNENYGAGGVRDGENITVAVPETMDVTIYYNDETHNSVCSVSYVFADVTLSGTGIPEGTKLTDKGLTGIYSATVPMTAGTYTDLTITCNGKTYSFAEIEIEEDKDVTFYIDPVTEIFYCDASDIPVNEKAIFFDSQDARYKQPFGAVATGETVTFAIDTGSDITSAVLVVKGIGPFPMTEEVTDTGKRWSASATFANIGEYDYYFSLSNGSTVVIYSDDDGYYGVGQVTELTSAQPYDLVVYKAGFETPDWVKDAVIYQIFPDRFFDGDISNNQAQRWARGEVNYEYITDWYTLPENPEQEALLNQSTYESTGAHWGDGEWSNEIYGGDLDGIIQRIDYLKALGVNVIYLNPIFWSISNHRYDAVDYTEIDPILGTMGDFKQLVSVAEANGMHIILDGVFNHVSDDSVYFDRYYRFLGSSNKIGAYPYWAYVYDYMSENKADQAAAEAAAKAFFSENYGITDYSYTAWFAVSSTTMPGTVDEMGLRAGKEVYSYEGWWGYDSMPVIYSTNGSEYQTGNWAQEIIRNGSNSSVTQYWIAKGNNGWRLDVANEVSDETWQRFRESVKALDSDAVIIGEIWDDATKYLKGDMYDSVMNYLFRNASTGFAMGTGAEKTMKTLEKIRERYPSEAFYAMMNLVGSHDTTRLLSYLDGIGDDRSDKSIRAAFPTYDETSDTAKERQYLVAFLQFTYAGAPTIYYGDEIGMVGADDPDDRRGMEWGRGDQSIVEWYAKLAAIRAAYPALRTGAVIPMDLDNNSLLGYIRQDEANTLTVIANNSADDQTVELEGRYIDLVTGEAFDGNIPSRSGVILVAEKEAKTITVNYAGLAPAWDPAYEVAERPAGVHTHEYKAVVTEPTCTEEGFTTFTCIAESCGDSYVSKEVPALGHSYETQVTAPTCTAEGYTTYTCSVCADTYQDDFVEMLPHSYTYEDEETVRTYTCEDCGHTYQRVALQVASGKNLTLKFTDPNTKKNIGGGQLNWTIDKCLVFLPDGTPVEFEDVAAYATLKNGTLKTLKCGDHVRLEITAVSKKDASVFGTYLVDILPAANMLSAYTVTQRNGYVYTNPVFYTGTNVLDLNGRTEADGDYLMFGADAYPYNSSQKINWKSSNTKVAQIVEDTIEYIDEYYDETLGEWVKEEKTLAVIKVYPVWNETTGAYKAGTATITATAADGSGKKATFKVEMASLPKSVEIVLNNDNPVPEDVYLEYAGVYAMKVQPGKSYTFKANVDPNASSNKKKVSWQIWDEFPVATVKNGKVTIAKDACNGDSCVLVAQSTESYDVQDQVYLVVESEKVVRSIDIYSVTMNDWGDVYLADNLIDVSTATEDNVPSGFFAATVHPWEQEHQDITWSIDKNSAKIADLVETDSEGNALVAWTDGFYPEGFGTVNDVPEDAELVLKACRLVPKWDGQKFKTGTVTLTATAPDGTKQSIKVKIESLINEMWIETKDGRPVTQNYHHGSAIATAGEKIQLKIVTNDNAKSKAVRWGFGKTRMSTHEYATISSSGVLTINKEIPSEGLWLPEIYADAKEGDARASIEFYVKPRATNVHLRAELDDTMKYVSNITRDWDINTDGGCLNLSALVYPFAADQNVKWTVSNKNIAQIVENEDHSAVLTFTGKKFGKLTITATTEDSAKVKSSFNLNVVSSVTDLSMKEGTVDFVAGGKALDLSKQILIEPANATNKKLVWSFSEDTQAAADAIKAKVSNGKVTSDAKLAAKAGITELTVVAETADGFHAQPLLWNISIHPATDKVYIHDGDDKALKTVDLNSCSELQLYADTNTKDACNSYTWTSSNPAVATVDKNGLVKAHALKDGKTIIKATAADGTGKNASITVYVKVNAASVKLQDLSVVENKTTDLSKLVQFLDADGCVVTPSDKSLVWSVTDLDGNAFPSTAATVSSKGVLTTWFYTGAYQFRVTATPLYGTAEPAECVVTVRPKMAILNAPAQLFLNGTVDLGTPNMLDTAANTVTWTSSDEGLAYVDANGVVTARHTGTVTITAVNGYGEKASVKIKIVPMTFKVSIQLPDRSGGTFTFTTDKTHLDDALLDEGFITGQYEYFENDSGLHSSFYVYSVNGIVGKDYRPYFAWMCCIYGTDPIEESFDIANVKIIPGGHYLFWASQY